MRKRLFLIGLLAVLLLLTSATAGAITWGGPDGDAHPYVGTVWWAIPDMPGWYQLCSASLISPTKIVTAGHCAEPAIHDDVEVLFQYQGQWIAYYYPATFYRHPGYCENCAPGLPSFINNDVAVVILDPGYSINLPQYAALPAQGLVDTLAMNTPIDLVGYGVQKRQHTPGEGPPYWVREAFTRYYAPTELVDANFKHSDRFIKMRANKSQGSGGTCFGDSGGPDLLGGTNIILAVNSYVTNSNCAGVVYSFRIDTADALGFINSVN